jgi:polyhydroxyalkanoate synthase subunit PhaC
MKATLGQGGRNLVAGARHFLHDMTANGGLPLMVDKSKLTVGGNLALNPGAVAHANDYLELIRYTPHAAEFRARPVFIVPPQINVWG